VAAALVNAVAGMPAGDRALALAAGGFRDTTRIAAGNPVMWRDIFLSNRERVLEALDGFRGAVEQLETALRRGDGEKILQILTAAGKIRTELPIRSRGYLPRVYEIVVTVPDRPGVIAMLAGMLAGAGINISEIEILRAREGYGGTIRIGFATPGEQERTLGLLQENEIKCRLKA
jgi:prephenate dehydrogenase